MLEAKSFLQLSGLDDPSSSELDAFTSSSQEGWFDVEQAKSVQAMRKHAEMSRKESEWGSLDLSCFREARAAIEAFLAESAEVKPKDRRVRRQGTSNASGTQRDTRIMLRQSKPRDQEIESFGQFKARYSGKHKH